MTTDMERQYYDKLSQEEIEYAKNKPFSSAFRGHYFIDIGEILALLPPPPARLLDLGCGTGWTSAVYARCGYDVVGLDVSRKAVAIASSTHDAGNLRFVVGDFETMGFQDAFECAVSYDSLHHSEDEEKAIACVYRALVPGGAYILCETGLGHSHTPFAVHVAKTHGVTEKDMPPRRIIPLLRKAGFRGVFTYPRMKDLLVSEVPEGPRGVRIERAVGRDAHRALKFLLTLGHFLRKHRGVVKAYK